MKAYSFTDLHYAKWVLSTNSTLIGYHGQPTMDWAKQIIDWFSHFYSVLAIYHRELKDWQLAVASIWQDIRSFVRLTDMFILLRKVVKSVQRKLNVILPSFYTPRQVDELDGKSTFGSGKKRSTKCHAIADMLQTMVY